MPRRALSKNWILAYNEAISKISEAPGQYNIWAAIAVVSAVLKNHVRLARGPYTVNPNQYIILVGPPGVGKGTAIHPAFEIPKRLGLINTISDRVTAQKIVERLSIGFDAPPKIIYGTSNGHTPQAAGVVPSIAGGTLFNTSSSPVIVATRESAATIMSTELQTLLSSSEWMTQFLCDAWDRKDFEYDTKNKGTHLVKDMCVSLVGACVPAYIQSINRSTEAAVNGGFTARAVFVYADKKSNDIVWPKNLEESEGPDFIKKLEEDLVTISNIEGEYSFTGEAKHLFENFYKSTHVKQEESDSDVMLYFKSRAHVHFFKVAMAFSAARSDERLIDRLDAILAIDLIKQIQANLDRAFRGVGNSPLADATQKVLNYIERMGAASRKQILKHNYTHVTNEDLTRVIYTLCEMGSIREDSVGGQKLYVYCEIQKTVNSTVGTINRP
jgi:Protein of unknown function (DUF3987)